MPQTIRITKDMEITREGDTLILRPVRPDWPSYAEVEKADDDRFPARTP